MNRKINMLIQKKILSIFRAIEAMYDPRGPSTFRSKVAALNALLTDDDKKVMADVVKAAILLTAGNQESLRDPSKYNAKKVKDTFNMMLSSKMYNVIDMLNLPIELMKKPTQEDYVMAKKLLPIMGSTSIGKDDIDTHVGKLSDLDRRFKSEGYDTVYRGLNKLQLNTIIYLMNEPTWDMKRGVSTSYDRTEAGRFAKLAPGFSSLGGPAVLFEISNASKRGFHADTLSRYYREKEVILSGDIKVSNEWVLEALGRITPDPDSGMAPGDIKINFDSKTMTNIFNWDYTDSSRTKQNIKTEKFPNREAFLSFCEEAILNQGPPLKVDGRDWGYEIIPRTILLKVKATLP